MQKTPKQKSHKVYIVLCSDETLYTGYTTNIIRRLKEHNSKNNKTKYTRIRQPVKLVYLKKFDSKEKALKYEYKVKQLSRKEKLKIIELADKKAT